MIFYMAIFYAKYKYDINKIHQYINILSEMNQNDIDYRFFKTFFVLLLDNKLENEILRVYEMIKNPQYKITLLFFKYLLFNNKDLLKKYFENFKGFILKEDLQYIRLNLKILDHNFTEVNKYFNEIIETSNQNLNFYQTYLKYLFDLEKEEEALMLVDAIQKKFGHHASTFEVIANYYLKQRNILYAMNLLGFIQNEGILFDFKTYLMYLEYLIDYNSNIDMVKKLLDHMASSRIYVKAEWDNIIKVLLEKFGDYFNLKKFDLKSLKVDLLDE
jgi:hypothetical protein